MNATNTPRPPVDRDGRTEPNPGDAAVWNGKTDGRLEAFKNRLLKGLSNEAATPGFQLAVRRAANEAAALVWLTPYPLLLLPVLMEEKVNRARDQWALQQRVKRRSDSLIQNVA